MAQQERVMRVPFSVDLIRQMDAVITEGRGGYETRREFIVDAVQERILELTVHDEVDAGAPASETPQVAGLGLDAERTARNTDVSHEPGAALAAVEDTQLDPPPQGFVIATEDAVDLCESRALFGLHNRDYPSLWALSFLARAASDRPVPIESFYEEVTEAAWKFGTLLKRLEERENAKYTALFPTNLEKRGAAETAFRMFAIGDYHRNKGSDPADVRTTGPLFTWQAARLVTQGDQLAIGLSSDGWNLVSGCAGLTVEEPHSEDLAFQFLDHLGKHSPADYAGFGELLNAIDADGCTRPELLAHFREIWPQWTDKEIATNAAGYVARSREWGLLQPNQIERRYRLTGLGGDTLARLRKDSEQ